MRLADILFGVFLGLAVALGVWIVAGTVITEVERQCGYVRFKGARDRGVYNIKLQDGSVVTAHRYEITPSNSWVYIEISTNIK